MSFLKSHRQRSDTTVQPSNAPPLQKRRSRKPAKVADTDAEISRYFTSTKVSDQQNQPLSVQYKHRSTSERSQSCVTKPELLALPSTPFLGFGSRGANSVSPAKRLDSPIMRELERNIDRMPARSTSYLTWSQSGACSKDYRSTQKHQSMPPASPRLQSRKSSCPASPKVDQPISPTSRVHREVHSARRNLNKSSRLSHQHKREEPRQRITEPAEQNLRHHKDPEQAHISLAERRHESPSTMIRPQALTVPARKIAPTLGAQCGDKPTSRPSSINLTETHISSLAPITKALLVQELLGYESGGKDNPLDAALESLLRNTVSREGKASHEAVGLTDSEIPEVVSTEAVDINQQCRYRRVPLCDPVNQPLAEPNVREEIIGVAEASQ